MQKLVCFGDSYLANDIKLPLVKPLAQRIAEKLDVPLLNYAASGSGMSYSLDMFYRYLVSGDYDTSDYIFFNTSHHLRLWLPQTGANFFTFPDTITEDSEVPANRFFKKHGHEINWAIENLNYELEHQVLHIVRTMAYQSLQGNRCMVVNAFEISDLCLEICQTATSTKRFRNLMFRGGLIVSSVAEFDDYRLVEWDNEAKYDRYNHYSDVNLDILADQFAAELQGKNAFDLSKLKRGFITAKR